MSQTENSNQAFLPGVGEHGSSYLQSVKSLSAFFKIKCDIRNADEQKYISQMSGFDIYD